MNRTVYINGPVDADELRRQAEERRVIRKEQHRDREIERALPYLIQRAQEDACEDAAGIAIPDSFKASPRLNPGPVRPYHHDPLTHVAIVTCPRCGRDGGEEVYEDGFLSSRSVCDGCTRAGGAQ